MNLWSRFNDKVLKTKRVRVWVDPKPQGRFVFDVFKHYVLIFFIGFFFVYMFPFVLWFTSNPPEEHRIALKDFVDVNMSKWPLWIFLVVVFVFYAIMLSHKIFGPLKGLKASFDRAQQGRAFEIRMRKGDYHQDLLKQIQAHQSLSESEYNALLLRSLDILEETQSNERAKALALDIQSFLNTES